MRRAATPRVLAGREGRGEVGRRPRRVPSHRDDRRERSLSPLESPPPPLPIARSSRRGGGRALQKPSARDRKAAACAAAAIGAIGAPRRRSRTTRTRRCGVYTLLSVCPHVLLVAPAARVVGQGVPPCSSGWASRGRARPRRRRPPSRLRLSGCCCGSSASRLRPAALERYPPRAAFGRCTAHAPRGVARLSAGASMRAARRSRRRGRRAPSNGTAPRLASAPRRPPRRRRDTNSSSPRARARAQRKTPDRVAARFRERAPRRVGRTRAAARRARAGRPEECPRPGHIAFDMAEVMCDTTKIKIKIKIKIEIGNEIEIEIEIDIKIEHTPTK